LLAANYGGNQILFVIGGVLVVDDKVVDCYVPEGTSTRGRYICVIVVPEGTPTRGEGNIVGDFRS